MKKLAGMAAQGKVCGLDHSAESVTLATRANRQWIDSGRVDIREGSVSQMPFAADSFDVVTAVETHFWWPNLAADMREVLRVLKPAGRLIVVAEVYRGANTITARIMEKHLPSGMTSLTANEHCELLANAAFVDIQIIEEPVRGWICGMGRKSTLPKGSL